MENSVFLKSQVYAVPENPIYEKNDYAVYKTLNGKTCVCYKDIKIANTDNAEWAKKIVESLALSP